MALPDAAAAEEGPTLLAAAAEEDEECDDEDAGPNRLRKWSCWASGRAESRVGTCLMRARVAAWDGE